MNHQSGDSDGANHNGKLASPKAGGGEAGLLPEGVARHEHLERAQEKRHLYGARTLSKAKNGNDIAGRLEGAHLRGAHGENSSRRRGGVEGAYHYGRRVRRRHQAYQAQSIFAEWHMRGENIARGSNSGEREGDSLNANLPIGRPRSVKMRSHDSSASAS